MAFTSSPYSTNAVACGLVDSNEWFYEEGWQYGMNNNVQLIEQQATLIQTLIAQHVRPGEDYAVIDFPDHPNVGDSAIWLGEMQLLSKLVHKEPAYVCTCESYSAEELRKICPEGPVFIHGGGNLGDLWPRHQDVREAVLRDFPGRRVIQLPQSIQFQQVARCDHFARLVQAHGNFHLLVRDQRSLAFARQRFDCPVDLSPDGAFGLGPLARSGMPTVQAYCLIRDDAETAGGDLSPLTALPSSIVADWLAEPAYFGVTMRLASAGLAVASGKWSRASRQHLACQRLAAHRLQRGLAMLSQGHCVLTDRLHAHILSVLMGLPNVVLDNNYGKIHGYMQAWTQQAYRTHMASSVVEAVELVKSLSLGGQPAGELAGAKAPVQVAGQ